ncbi:MAG TPA: SH3 domain-containing protein [Candidatus Limnocylindria bacterium]
MGIRRASPIVACLVAAACTMPPLETPTPTPSPTATASPAPTATAEPTPTPTASAGSADVPRFAGAELVVTTIDGMRVRQRPGTDARVIAALLPLQATLEVVMGPIVTDGQGWYLVADADELDLGFDEGWIAAGYEPDPFLVTTGATADGSLTVVGLAGDGNAEHGPVGIDEDTEYAIRWVAADPERVGCSFAVSLAVGSDAPVPAIRATIGGDLVPGTLQPNALQELGISGLVFLGVTSDCEWTLAIVRVPEATPTPSPTG